MFTSLFKVPTAYAQKSPEELIGSVDTPPGVELINQEAGVDNIAIIYFASNIIKIFVWIGGLWIIVNVVLAAYGYLTSGGKADAASKARDRLSMSVVGLLLMVASYTIAGIIGLVFFGDATYIINPQIAPIGGGTP